MEKQKQELLRLIDNLDWDKFTYNNKSLELLKNRLSQDSRGRYIDNDTKLPISYFNQLQIILQECQKQPSIEQQLKELGFIKVPDCGYDVPVKTLIYTAYHTERDSNKIHMAYYLESGNGYYIGYSIVLYKNNIDKILSFAKYLKQLKEEDDACQSI